MINIIFINALNMNNIQHDIIPIISKIRTNKKIIIRITYENTILNHV